MFRFLFRRPDPRPSELSRLPRAIRDEVLSICRAAGLAETRDGTPVKADCGCLDR